jgi:hypothetical protein
LGKCIEELISIVEGNLFQMADCRGKERIGKPVGLCPGVNFVQGIGGSCIAIMGCTTFNNI